MWGLLRLIPIINTGAEVTPLRKDVWDKLPQVGKLLVPWEGSPLVGVAGNPLEVWGSVMAEWKTFT